MTVQVYRTQSYKTTHENRLFDDLGNELERVWGDSDDLIILLGNFYCQGSEIDAAILKKNSITVIDFKDYGGNISFSENGPWLAGDVEVRGGSKPNPFIQVRDNRFALLDVLKKIRFPSDRQQNLGHISGLVLFHQPITFDEGQLPPKIKSWFHVVEFDRALERLSQIASPDINLSNQDLADIVQHFSIPEYVHPGWGIKAIPGYLSAGDSAKSQLPKSLESVVSGIEQFLGSSKKILIVTGMMGTGLHLLQTAIGDKSRSLSRNYSVLAPNSKIASVYPLESKSIYSYIFTKNYTVEKEQLVYGLNKNLDTEQQVYIVGDAHLISDSQFETDFFRYGSGQILTDFLEYTQLDKTQRQVIFLGDPFQLMRGKKDESALCGERLQAAIYGEIERINLEFILPDKVQDLFVQNCQQIAQSIHHGRFNQLRAIADDSNCIQIVDRDNEEEVSRSVFLEDSQFTKFIVFSNEAANRINDRVRQEFFNRGKEIVAGDIVHIHNSPVAADEGKLEQSYISNNSFAEVIAVNPHISPLIQPLKGREQPVKVNFLRVRVRLLENGKEIEFYCLRDYLYSEKPEVDKDTLLALRVAATNKFKEQQKQIIESDKSMELAKFLRTDPYLNAARLRFGYALTLHRAQGQKFKTAIANMDTSQGKTNAAYFRWVYTLFSVVQNRLFLFNFPSITPFFKANWNNSQGKLDSVVFKDLIAFDPNSELGNANVSPFPILGKPLINLYLHIAASLIVHQIQVTSYKHNSYQEVYEFASEDGRSSCCIRLHYNAKFQVTRIEKGKSEPIDFAALVRDAIASKLRAGNEFQQTVQAIIQAKLASHKITIWGIEHHDYNQIYYLKSEQGELKMQVFYDGDGFVTQVWPIGYTNLKIAELVRLALEL
ncbi:MULTISPECIES: NERD domain-containing protein [unclassified Microcoleus]|uniref:NERD domain-containing protein n=1 Tax=unclassified Microcoleus TaxID=2642155 RepID=UPI0025F35B08|nr:MULTISPECIES: NERD domain-containing protein [unclassified Microcoleus]